ncbi:SRPBCC family protein [Arthrobacter sp. NPDC056727]|uniref:SRPBCC family protein n=1 Tax=Arthrobacter sp. NPDC056727 TaxID=3345927 RepID=UPI00367103C3
MSNALKFTAPDGVPFIDWQREFDFPVGEVFRAHKEPGLVAQWLGPHGTNVDIDHYDFRSGGSYLYNHAGADGGTHAANGIFHTVRENEFAVQTFEFSGYPDVVLIEFTNFEDLGGGRCRLRGHLVCPTVEARDGMAQPDMESGMRDGYERLEALLAK